MQPQSLMRFNSGIENNEDSDNIEPQANQIKEESDEESDQEKESSNNEQP